MTLPEASSAPTSLRELALLFARLGSTALGGPAVHIAMMQDEVVRRRAWLSEQSFLDLLGATNLIPGPNSTEMAIHIGWARRRWAGLVVAGLAFILPATFLTAALAWAYVRGSSAPSFPWLLYGVKPVTLSIVLQAVWTLAPKAASTWRLRAIGALTAVGFVLTPSDILLILIAGAVAVVWRRREASAGPPELRGFAPALSLAAGGAAASTVTHSGLFWVFFKISSLLFGSGYVLLAFLRAELVLRLGWLTEAQIIDAIAVGQVTPGPVFTTATFVGWLLAGPGGAAAATAGIFAPAFMFVALSGPYVPSLRRLPAAAAFLDGVNVASLALMVVVTLQLGRSAIVDVPSLLLALAAAVLLVRFKLNASWLVLAGAALGWAVGALRG